MVALELIKMFRQGLDYTRFHLIGFSIGAHISAVIGRTAQRASYILPRLIQFSTDADNSFWILSSVNYRITGLDPAFPLFYNSSNNKELNKEDAKFVDIIHTDAGIFGGPVSTGHADFYPNGGRRPQPRCKDEPETFFFLGMKYNQILVWRFNKCRFLDHCAHDSAIHYYADSVTAEENKFLATNRQNSSNKAQMGYNCPIT